MSQPDCQDLLAAAVKAAKAPVTGWRRVHYLQHALLIKTALAAFGDDDRATFYIETLSPNTNLPRPDLIILHPDVGVLAIENKGITLEQIHAVENTAIHLTRDGRIKIEDPFAQVEHVMYTLKDLAALRFDVREALFLRTVAFPRLRRSEIEGRFNCRFPHETLFSDACHDPAEFRRQVLAYANNAFREHGENHRLSRRAAEILTDVILSGTSVFTPARPNPADPPPLTLGAQVQELELATREPTQQQREFARADLRGAHRLFRGVAGSGKSILLALSAAQTLLLHREEAATLFAPQNPKRILVTCFNRSLVPYLRSRIEERFARIAWSKPADDELLVTHFEGLVKTLERNHEQLRTNLDFKKKTDRAAKLCQHFDRLPPTLQTALAFDAVYVDEAQDLEPPELEFLRRLAKPDAKNNQTLLLFYDNAQNIYGTSAPTWSSLGINIVGRTQFLDQCLRNTRQTLEFAFNILVGSYAPEHARVSTRQFADVASLKQRNLIAESGRGGNAFSIRFAPREGPVPIVSLHPTRAEEITAVVAEVRRLIHDQGVLPRDILILYASHHAYKDLPAQLEKILPPDHTLRQVDSLHAANKNLPLLEDNVLTLSTIASAKGYDAPIVLLLGVDALSTSDQDRARFYVAATRPKLLLYLFATQTTTPTLLPEIVAAAANVPPLVPRPSGIASLVVDKTGGHAPPNLTEPSRYQDLASPPRPTQPLYQCQNCGSKNLHCQQGGNGYYFLCIDCTTPNPLPRRCPTCGHTARIRAKARDFYRICPHCQSRTKIHTNKPLDSF